MLAAAPYPLPAALMLFAGYMRRRTLRSPRLLDAALDARAEDGDPISAEDDIDRDSLPR